MKERNNSVWSVNNGFSYWLKHSLSHLKLHVMSNIYSEKDVIEQIETRSFLLKNLWSLQVRSYELRLFWNLIWSKICFYGHWKSVLWLFSFCLKLIVISFSKFYLERNVCQNVMPQFAKECKWDLWKVASLLSKGTFLQL